MLYNAIIALGFAGTAHGLAILSEATLAAAESEAPYSSAPTAEGAISAGYFTNWGSLTPDRIPVASLSHVIYSFALVRESGEVYLKDDVDIRNKWAGDAHEAGNNMYGLFRQIYQLKLRNRRLKVLLAIGGWNARDSFAAPLSTEVGRRLFVTSCIDLLEDLGLDGFDIDWEYPNNPEKAIHFLKVVKLLRYALDEHAASKSISPKDGYDLSIAVAGGISNAQHYLVRELDPYLSFWNIMTYDFSGPSKSWSQRTAHHANLYDPSEKTHSGANTVKYYIDHGATSSKVLLGIPLYGRSFGSSTGMATEYEGPGGGTAERGLYDCRSLPLAGSVEAYDAAWVATECFSAESGEWVTYDTVEGAQVKARYIVQERLGGAMYWELAGDHDALSGKSIIAAVAYTLLPLDSRLNHIDFPRSQYLNVRNNMGVQPDAKPQFISTSSSTPSRPINNRRLVVGYYSDGPRFDEAYGLHDVQVSALTHLILSLAEVNENGTVVVSDHDLKHKLVSDAQDEAGRNVYGNIKQLFLLKQSHRHLKTMLSIPGASSVPLWSTAQGRANFVRSSVALVEDLGLDGLDITWITSVDRAQNEQFVLLLQELRAGLDQLSLDRAFHGEGRFQLSMNIKPSINFTVHHDSDIVKIDLLVDFWVILAQEPEIINTNLISSKIVLALPAFACYASAASLSSACDSRVTEREALMIARGKAKLILANKLRGVAFSDVSSDYSGAASIIGSLGRVLAPLDSTLNRIEYPGSKYKNIRSRMGLNRARP